MREQEFADIIKENKPRLRRLCRVYTQRRQDEKDLFQEVLIQIWQSLPTFENNASLNTWIYRVAVNTAISFQRKKNTRREYYKKYREEQNSKEEVSRRSGQTGTEKLDRLHAAIDTLNSSEKAIISMYLEDFSYEEIAYVTDLTENYVGVKLHRIKNKISKKIDGRNGA